MKRDQRQHFNSTDEEPMKYEPGDGSSTFVVKSDLVELDKIPYDPTYWERLKKENRKQLARIRREEKKLLRSMGLRPEGERKEKPEIPEIGKRQIEALLRFLPLFEGRTSFGEWWSRAGVFPHFAFIPEVDEFIEVFYEPKNLFNFDWSKWQKKAEKHFSDPTTLASARLVTIRKLLTLHVRKERFCEGHLAEALASGHITALLQRLKKLSERMK